MAASCSFCAARRASFPSAFSMSLLKSIRYLTRIRLIKACCSPSLGKLAQLIFYQMLGARYSVMDHLKLQQSLLPFHIKVAFNGELPKHAIESIKIVIHLCLRCRQLISLQQQQQLAAVSHQLGQNDITHSVRPAFCWAMALSRSSTGMASQPLLTVSIRVITSSMAAMSMSRLASIIRAFM